MTTSDERPTPSARATSAARPTSDERPSSAARPTSDERPTAEARPTSAERLADLQRQKMLGVLAGTWLAQGCSVLAELGIPDLLAERARGADELALAAGADPVALSRLLAALAAAGILREPEPGRYALTPMADYLRADRPGSLRSTAVLYGAEVYRSFGGLLDTVRTGEPAFARVHGLPFYGYLAEHPAAAELFATAMAGQGVPPALSSALLSGVRCLVDVGGGDGGLLAEVLARDPQLRGVLLELPEAARAARHRLAAAGVLDRAEIVEGSFFDAVPAGGDLYVLSRVLHNWSDENAARILARLYAAMAPGARLVVLEGLLPDAPQPTQAASRPNASRPNASRPNEGRPDEELPDDERPNEVRPDDERPKGRRADEARTRMVDLLMLVMLEGRDRSATGYAKLLVAAGFRVLGSTGPVTDAAAAEGAIEAVRD